MTLLAQERGNFKYQAVLRDTDGNAISSEQVLLQMTLLQGSESGNSVYSEEHTVTTNFFGIVNLNIGDGSAISGVFADIDWENFIYYLQIELNRNNTGYEIIGVSPLLSVPYALHAETVTNKDDADADPTNEIQNLDLSNNILTITNNAASAEIDLAPFQGTNTDQQILSLINDTLKISGGNEIVLPYGSSLWKKNGSNISYNAGNVGIGTENPNSKFEVRADDSFTEVDTLFSVKDKNGNVVFAVFPDGAKVYINEGVKGKVGGFAVSGRNPSKGLVSDYLVVTNDSTRVYVDNMAPTKGKVGGFAVSGRNPSKGTAYDYLVVTGDSTRIYVNDNEVVKGKVGGFAVSGRNPSKGSLNDYIKVTRDSTRIYVEDPNAGFSVQNTETGNDQNLMKLVKDNYFIGHESGTNTSPNPVDSSGMFNSFLGYLSGQENTSGSYNSFYGYKSGSSNTTGSDNVYIGNNAGMLSTSGGDNVFIGNKAGANNTIGSDNVFIGDKAGFANDTASDNVFIGNNAGNMNTYGTANVFIGDNAGDKNTTGNYNVFMGKSAGKDNSDGSENVFIGERAGHENTSGGRNIFLGSHAGYNNLTGSDNVFFGTQAGYSNTIGIDNVFLGNGTGGANTEGASNVFLGNQAGQSNTTGSVNVFLGQWAGYSNIDGSYNVFLGSAAGADHTSGNSNVFIGDGAGEYNSVGYENILIGFDAGKNLTDGNSNLFLGSNAGLENNDGFGNVFLGNYAGMFEMGSERLYISNHTGGPSEALIYGEFDNARISLNATVNIRDMFAFDIDTVDYLFSNDILSPFKSSILVGSGEGTAISLDATNSIEDGLEIGQLLILFGNDDTNTITVKDNANTKLGADRILGLKDVLTLVWDGEDWLEISYTDN